MTSSVKEPKCKKCGHKPSTMGKEPMYLIPKEITYHIYCGKCFTKILKKCGIAVNLDYSNLFTHFYTDVI